MPGQHFGLGLGAVGFLAYVVALLLGRKPDKA